MCVHVTVMRILTTNVVYKSARSKISTTMEIEDGAIFYKAIVEKVTNCDCYMLLQLRSKKRHFWNSKKPNYKIKAVRISDDERAMALFCAAQKLRAGDTVWVECYHTEWQNPEYLFFICRWWNILFG